MDPKNKHDRLPVEDSVSDFLIPVNGHTVLFYYLNAGVKTIDAGQAAGVLIFGNIGYTGIKNALGDAVGSYLDSSFDFVTGTTLTAQVAFPYEKWKAYQTATLAAKIAKLGEDLLQGQFFLDHETGLFVGMKADAGVSDTANFLVSSKSVSYANSFGYYDAANEVAKVKSLLVNDLQYNSEQEFFDGLASAALPIKNAPVAVAKLVLFNTGGTAFYVILKNSDDALVTTVTAVDPENGDRVFYLPANGTREVKASDFPEGQMFFSEGLQLGMSTTPTVYTEFGTPANLKVEIHHN